MGFRSMNGRKLIDTWWDDTPVASSLPLDLDVNTYRTLFRVALPVAAGDVLDIYADAKVTNDTGIVTGIGYHLWMYNASAPSGVTRNATWREIPTSLGENVIPAVHHLVLNIGRMFIVPDDWYPGHSIGIALRADAHSTGWATNGGGQAITVDPCGIVKVRQWRAEAA